MATQEFKRKLTTILSADVKGYSRLIVEDDGKKNSKINLSEKELNNQNVLSFRIRFLISDHLDADI